MTEQIATTTIKRNSLGVCFARTARSWGIFVISLSFIYIILTVDGQRSTEIHTAKVPTAPTVCMPDTGNNYCAPVGDARVLDAVLKLEGAGLTCSAKSALTDVVVFQFRVDKSVEVVSFDRAIALGKSSQGWVQAFCL